jgi:hypothetical protein
VCDNEGQSCQQREDRIRIVADTDQWANVEDRDERSATIITARSAVAVPGRGSAILSVAHPFKGAIPAGKRAIAKRDPPIPTAAGIFDADYRFPACKARSDTDRIFGNSRPALIVSTVG